MEGWVRGYHYGDLQSRVQVLDVSTELAGTDPFGQVKAGSLTYLRAAGPMLCGIRFNHKETVSLSLQRKFPTVSYQGQCSSSGGFLDR